MRGSGEQEDTDELRVGSVYRRVRVYTYTDVNRM